MDRYIVKTLMIRGKHTDFIDWILYGLETSKSSDGKYTETLKDCSKIKIEDLRQTSRVSFYGDQVQAWFKIKEYEETSFEEVDAAFRKYNLTCRLTLATETNHLVGNKYIVEETSKTIGNLGNIEDFRFFKRFTFVGEDSRKYMDFHLDSISELTNKIKMRNTFKNFNEKDDAKHDFIVSSIIKLLEDSGFEVV